MDTKIGYLDKYYCNYVNSNDNTDYRNNND